MYFIDLTGKTFGRLSVIKRTPTTTSKPLKWLCKCTCGNTRIAVGNSLKKGVTTGCYKCYKADISKRFRKYTEDTLYTRISWRCTMSRCLYRPMVDRGKRTNYYKQKNIKLCKRWHKFENFLADMGPRPQGMTIERKNNNGNYTPKNCVWATPKEQAQNRRPRKDCRWLTYKGETKPIQEWARILNIKWRTINGRINQGWTSAEKILTAPIKPWGR
jgi:hypothetical protein